MHHGKTAFVPGSWSCAVLGPWYFLHLLLIGPELGLGANPSLSSVGLILSVYIIYQKKQSFLLHKTDYRTGP